MIKADAYGHGAVRVAQTLEAQADGFAVACIEEALELRAAGIRAPILLLEGFFEADELALIVEHDLWTVVHSTWQLEAIERAHPGKPLTVWLKLDTGMHRVGLHPSEYRAAYQRLLSTGNVAKIVLMTHFACADELNSPSSAEQCAVFEATCQGLAAETSLKNSPAVMGWPKIPGDWSRAGIMLYGATPFDQAQPLAERLQPVMTLESKIISVRDLPAGEAVGYGATFVTDKPSRIGVVAMVSTSRPDRNPCADRRPTLPAGRAGVHGHALRRPHRAAASGYRQPGRAVGQSGAGQRRRGAGRHHPVPDILQSAARSAGLFRKLISEHSRCVLAVPVPVEVL